MEQYIRVKYLDFPLYSGKSMRVIVKMDQKGRIHLSNKVRKSLKIRPRQLLTIEVKGDVAIVRRAVKLKESEDRLLRDLNNPLHTKVKVTSELLRKMKDELWSG